MCLAGVAMNADAGQTSKKEVAAALGTYLAGHGYFCLGKFDWPIDVSDAELAMKTNNAVQLPVLEKLGLVASSRINALQNTGETERSAPFTRYALTEAGKKFYLSRETVSGKTVHHGDFCAGKLSLDKVVRWDESPVTSGGTELTAIYTYKITATQWAQDPNVQRVFPMLARVVKGNQKMQLEQRFRLADGAWVALNPQD